MNFLFNSNYLEQVESGTWPSSVTNLNSIYDVKDGFSTYLSVDGFSVKAWTVSNALYYLYFIFDGVDTVVRKQNSDSTIAWTSALPYTPFQKSLWVDGLEQNVYYSVFKKSLSVIRLDASAGGLISARTL